MDTAIVTGASRGLGLALTRALAERGWTVVVDARDGDALARGDAGSRRRRRRPGRRHRSAPPCRARRRRRRRDRPARQQRERARPEPAAAARRVSTWGSCAASSRSTCSRRSRSSRRRCRACATTRRSSTSAPTPPSSRTRAGAATAPPRPRSISSPRSSPPSTRRCACTPSIRATCARRCTRTRSRGRTSPTVRRPRRACPGSSRWSKARCRAGATGPRELDAGARMTIAAFPEIAPATAPPETLGPASDVALLVATRADGEIATARFTDLPRLLRPGDLLVVNTSATLPAALPGRVDGADVVVHLSTPLDGDRWVWSCAPPSSDRASTAARPSTSSFPPAGVARLLGPVPRERAAWPRRAWSSRAARRLPRPARRPDPLSRRGAALAARRVPDDLRPRGRQRRDAERRAAVQPTSSSPSCVSAGILVAPLVLHAGVSSLERGEAPYPERYRVPPETARVVNAVRSGGGASSPSARPSSARWRPSPTRPGACARARAGRASSSRPSAGLRASDGLLTGWHEPESSHLLMLEAAAGRELLERSYAEAAASGFAGHEFGDSHLILP